MKFALSMSPEAIGVHVNCEHTEDLKAEWHKYVEEPTMKLGMPAPKLVILESPFVVNPIMDYVLELERKDPGRQIAVPFPELVGRHWYYYFLQNRRAAVLKGLLYVKGSQQIAVVNVPWYLDF